jgi:hypothetical protein
LLICIFSDGPYFSTRVSNLSIASLTSVRDAPN